LPGPAARVRALADNLHPARAQGVNGGSDQQYGVFTMSPHTLGRSATAALAVLAALLSGCERPPVDTVQRGFRGTAMVQVYNPRTVAEQAPGNVVPAALAPASQDGPKAATVYQNVQVLGDLSVGEFTRTMLAMTAWVAPNEGCTYCHNAANFADDGKYTKVVARRMVQMTQNINATWKPHVVQTGVTCYTCHRGNAIPANVWFKPTEPESRGLLQATGGLPANGGGAMAMTSGPGSPSASVLGSLPADPFTPFLLEAQNIRVNGTSALPDRNRERRGQSIQQTEWTYSLMNHMSTSLGVNCTYCHNSENFASWEMSTPQRVTAWYGIRMVREANLAYMEPLTGTFPPHRLGPTGDVAKVNCTTCHQGAYKPLYGVSMLKDYPAFAAPQAAPASAPAVTPVTPETAS